MHLLKELIPSDPGTDLELVCVLSQEFNCLQNIGRMEPRHLLGSIDIVYTEYDTTKSVDRYSKHRTAKTIALLLNV